MRSHVVALSLLALTAACSKKNAQSVATPDSLAESDSSDVKTARCSQVSELEGIVIRETLLLHVSEDSVSGTYHYATGDRSALNDTGFQHLFGKILNTDSKDKNKVTFKLSNSSVTTFFDEDFAAAKELSEISYDLKEKTVSYTIAQDERVTKVGSCQFE